MNANHAHEQASDVVAEAGTVIMEGPDGVAVTMTPAAAEETAHRLLAAVDRARSGQDDGTAD